MDMKNAVEAASKLKETIWAELVSSHKERVNGWLNCDEDEQSRIISRCEAIAEKVIRGALHTIVGRRFPAITMGDLKYTNEPAKQIVKFQAQVSPSPELLVQLVQHGERKAILILCDEEDFFGVENAPQPMPDEPSLALVNIK